MHYCRTLKFEEKPDYNYLRNLFKKLFITLNIPYDLSYDWVLNLNINLESQDSDVTLVDKKLPYNQIESFSLLAKKRISDDKIQEVNKENNDEHIIQISNIELDEGESDVKLK